MSHDWQEQARVYAERIAMLERIAIADETTRKRLQDDVHVLRMERDNAESEAEALQVRIQELQAELRQYEPSDGVMHQLLVD